ncbi:MAG: hypothetical protein HKN87_11535 [Saprospiraceae bacterium]|nr:hypothetical protein [Saprospiraceae bacterium]
MKENWIVPIFSSVLLLLAIACDKDVKGPISNDIPESNGSHHPFLIVQKDEFPALRDRSDREPWKSMQEDAIVRSKRGSKTRHYDLQNYVGAAALAYILDVEHSAEHADRVKNAIVDQYAQLTVGENNGWGGVVPNMGSFYMAILALDIVYDALDSLEVRQCEKVIEDQIFKIKREGSWVDVRYGTHGTWDIYKGIRTTPDDKYYDGIMLQITDDGVSPVTIHYAWERVGGGNSRLSKAGYMDVLEYTGIDNRYYDNERLKKFHRWLFGSSINCAKEMAIIGDMLPTQTIGNYMLQRRVVNFDAEAAGYAAWYYKGVKAQGSILTYILPKTPLPDPVVPSSKLYINGGAFFREKADDPHGLHLVLYNIKSQDEWHTHEEVNGLALSGYGNRLLVNGGRLGAPTRPAPLNNTLTMFGNNHTSRLGGGIVEGFVTEHLDYASGSSGGAIAGRKHMRNALLVHRINGAQPYVILYDEVAATPGNQVITYLHPANETNITVESADEEYVADINHQQSVSGSQLTIYYATPPEAVDIEKVPSAVMDRYPDYPDHNRLGAAYSIGTNGSIQIATLLFPHNSLHPKPPISRIVGDHYSGCTVTHPSGVTDLILCGAGDSLVVTETVTFKGKAVLSRSTGDIIHYFVRHGTEFVQSSSGFTAQDPITIYNEDGNGTITSNGTSIMINGDNLDGLTFDPSVDIVSNDGKTLQANIPPGTIQFWKQ